MTTRSGSFLLAGFSVFCMAASLRADIITSTPDLPPLYPEVFTDIRQTNPSLMDWDCW